MFENAKKLRVAIAIRFELPTPPTAEQLREIMLRLHKEIILPPEERWREIVRDVVKPKGRGKRGGLDYSDLNLLLLQCLAEAREIERKSQHAES